MSESLKKIKQEGRITIVCGLCHRVLRTEKWSPKKIEDYKDVLSWDSLTGFRPFVETTGPCWSCREERDR